MSTMSIFYRTKSNDSPLDLGRESTRLSATHAETNRVLVENVIEVSWTHNDMLHLDTDCVRQRRADIQALRVAQSC
jgi:hypothetical protein